MRSSALCDSAGFDHPQTPKTYRRVLCGFQDVVRRCERSSSRVSLRTLKDWLQERGAEWSAFTLLHRACIIDRFLDFLCAKGRSPAIRSRSCEPNTDKGSATIVRALSPPSPKGRWKRCGSCLSSAACSAT